MYLDHFDLAVEPFSLAPKRDFVYPSDTFQESMAHLLYGLENQEAVVLITGPIGSGKTTALQAFLGNLGDRYDSALVTNTNVSAKELLKLILEDLGAARIENPDKSDLLILFKDYLLQAHRAGKRVLVVVDEAQNLATDVLEEIRLLTNLGQGDSQPVQIILAGQPELEAKVNRPELAQLRQRVRIHYKLEPLTMKETAAYLHHRMAVAGCERQVFRDDVAGEIFRRTGGVPRLINSLAAEALLAAFVADRDHVRPQDLPALVTDPAAEVVVEERAVPDAPAAVPPPPRTRERGNRSAARGGRRAAAWVVSLVVLVSLAVAAYNLGYLEAASSAFSSHSGADAPQLQRDDPPEQAAQVVGASSEAAETELVPVGGDDPGGEQARQDGLAAAESSGATEDRPQQLEEEAVDTGDPALEERPATVDQVYLHVHSFRTRERAETYVARWSGPPAGFRIEEQVTRGVQWHRVYIGPFPDHVAAEAEASALIADGLITYSRAVVLPPLNRS
jgi:type II secretory pathway predicted ATPase ExeA/cell division protein FtsN